eukprot:COSAG02_NODE_48527_length_333_cov_0.662393_1_plen_20_part_10
MMKLLVASALVAAASAKTLY